MNKQILLLTLFVPFSSIFAATFAPLPTDCSRALLRYVNPESEGLQVEIQWNDDVSDENAPLGAVQVQDYIRRLEETIAASELIDENAADEFVPSIDEVPVNFVFPVKSAEMAKDILEWI